MTIIDDIRHAYRLTVGYRWKFWMAFLPVLFLLTASLLITVQKVHNPSISLNVLQILIQAIVAFAVVGLYRFGLLRAREQACGAFRTVWDVSQWRAGLAYIGASIILTVIVTLGMVLIGLLGHIVPISVVMVLSLFYLFFIFLGTVFIPLIILDGQLPWYKAVFGSFVLIRYGFSEFAQLVVAALILMIVSILTLGILFVWVLPLLFVLTSGTYLRLLNHAKR
ncbi:hypothetical protein PsalMR5_00297 [Piscirickettsia salmonis]|uniref:hypothetical protein n=1 Tax=Piscirickettsia salmonis TaxID=1238 RepID=UPI0012BAD188|nr:hypothetical protein [Piscirickettsia salmonis]QGP52894.1 hypothetical protein PsalSR1_00293 [Piscirickettsia salmonis]QGP61181.1 hypothetical protein PsalBI1_03810 [Piscirickettsia salmonis]QGP62466.1 hypothetical protein PsalMR5_00297 [Piscirickettsia salmonis]